MLTNASGTFVRLRDNVALRREGRRSKIQKLHMWLLGNGGVMIAHCVFVVGTLHLVFFKCQLSKGAPSLQASIKTALDRPSVAHWTWENGSSVFFLSLPLNADQTLRGANCVRVNSSHRSAGFAENCITWNWMKLLKFADFCAWRKLPGSLECRVARQIFHANLNQSA